LAPRLGGPAFWRAGALPLGCHPRRAPRLP
jgi:hypothetical protein